MSLSSFKVLGCVVAASTFVSVSAFAQGDNILNPSDIFTISHGVAVVATLEQGEDIEPAAIFFSTSSLNSLSLLGGAPFLGADASANSTNTGFVVLLQPGSLAAAQVSALNGLHLVVGTGLGNALRTAFAGLQLPAPPIGLSDIFGVVSGIDTTPGTTTLSGLHSLGFISDSENLNQAQDLGATVASTGSITFVVEGSGPASANQFLSAAAIDAGYNASFISDVEGVPDTGMSLNLFAVGIAAILFAKRLCSSTLNLDPTPQSCRAKMPRLA